MIYYLILVSNIDLGSIHILYIMPISISIGSARVKSTMGSGEVRENFDKFDLSNKIII